MSKGLDWPKANGETLVRVRGCEPVALEDRTLVDGRLRPSKAAQAKQQKTRAVAKATDRPRLPRPTGPKVRWETKELALQAILRGEAEKLKIKADREARKEADRQRRLASRRAGRQGAKPSGNSDAKLTGNADGDIPEATATQKVGRTSRSVPVAYKAASAPGCSRPLSSKP